MKYQLDLGEQELVAADKEAVKFVSNAIYKILPLPFGGFLAFDPEFVYFYGESHDCIDARKLRQSMVISALLQYDDYDPVSMLTTEGKEFMRFLAATEAGELYMIAFHL